MEFNRRTILAGVAATSGIVAFPIEAETNDDSWVSGLPWVKANCPDSHISNVRVPSDTIFRVRSDLKRTEYAQLARSIFYGDRPGFVGMAAHYNAASPDRAQNAVNVLLGTAARNRTSLWAIGWGERSIHMISPTGDPLRDSGYAGLVVKDWRYATRAANIQASDISSTLLNRMLARIPAVFSPGIVTALYASSDSVAALAANGIVGSYRRIPIVSAPLHHREEHVS